jgi:regulator of protease activity HflC (stomatin/prohibitin superfamily)
MAVDISLIIGFVLLIVIVVLAVMSSGIKIVRPYEQGIYMRLGRYMRVLNQGFNFVTPLVNSVIMIDLRTQVLEVPRQEVITKDNSPTNIDAIIYIKVIDPQKAFFQVTNYRTATIYLAQTTLRSLVGDMELDEILSNRQRINLHLRDVLDEATDKWGVKVEGVEIREVDPAGKVKDAMEEQTSAERLRRAAILKADGQRRSAILNAEGEKRSRILQAEGLRQAKILEAEGERLAIILRSQGDAQKLRILSVGASPLDSKALTVLSLETLKSLGNGQATKIIFPFELTKLVEGASQYLGIGRQTPQREVIDVKDIERAVGRADDILGPIPTPDELHQELKALEATAADEKKEAEEVEQIVRKTAAAKREQEMLEKRQAND